MELLSNYKHYIVIIIITVVLGYFLGITVSTVVDYRLKEAVINLPKAKNNITVKIEDQNLKSKLIRKRDIDYKNTIEGFKSKSNIKKDKIKAAKKKMASKKKIASKNKKTENKKRETKKVLDKKAKKQLDKTDLNMNAYAKNFKNSEKNKKNEEKDGLKPFNEEFTNYNYQSIE